MTNLWLLAQMRQPGRTVYADFDRNTFIDFLETLLDKDNLNFYKEVDGRPMISPSWSYFLSYERTCVVQPVPLTGTSTYARKSWGGHTRCDLAPLTTSFGTVGQWERQHLPVAGSEHPHSPRNATAHRAAQTILHLPQWSRAKPQQVAGVRGLYGLVPPLILFVISYVNGGFDALGI